MVNTPEQIGRYTILEQLAVGGMATVYLGFETGETGLQRVVVLKQILPKHSDDESFKRMFMQEARLAANIHHPNVVEIHELGLSDDQPFIAMEYVAGVPLNLLMRHTQEEGVPIPVGVAIGIIAQACAGAHAAHELTDPSGEYANLVHRDLTPHNLIIGESGHVKVLDFGVAKASSNQEKTQTGMLKGKLPYMSPEQLWQKELDRRSDVFTLGVVLWELLLGKRLFQREAEVATINAVLNSTLPKIEAIRTDVPDSIVDAAMRALAKEPSERFESADALKHALLDAGRADQLDSSEDFIQSFVQQQLGPNLQARRAEVSAQVEMSINRVPSETVTASPPDDERSTSAALTTKGIKRGVLAGALGGFIIVGSTIGVLSQTGIVGNNETRIGSGPSDPSAITIMLAPTVDPQILSRDLEPLKKYLSRTMGRPVDWRFAATYSETSEALLDKKVPFASLPPTLYVQTAAANTDVELVVVKVHSGSTGSDGVLLVRESAQLQGIDDLKGRKICYTDPQSTTGYILPRAHLRQHGIDPDKDLQTPAIISGNHLQLIKDVIDGRCDVGGTFTAAYMAADSEDIQSAQARVLAITGRTPHDAIVAGPGVPSDLTAQLRQAFLDFDPMREAGTQALGEVERITGFSQVSDDVYDSVRKALDAERRAAIASPE
jgi:phosphate/phosphite/phosphonate ABC transporter binding protein